jgi:HD domain
MRPPTPPPFGRRFRITASDVTGVRRNLRQRTQHRYSLVSRDYGHPYVAVCGVVYAPTMLEWCWNPTSGEGFPQASAAAAYAEDKHAGQRRADGTQFIGHPFEVARFLYSAGAADDVIAAGLLHDVIEKADASASELRTRFGPRITGLVIAVSDDDRIEGYARRKAALRHQVADAGDDALTLFAADKLSKLRELHRETMISRRARLPRSQARRLQHYQRSLVLLQERLPESPLVRDLHDELDSFLRERAMVSATG